MYIDDAFLIISSFQTVPYPFGAAIFTRQDEDMVSFRAASGCPMYGSLSSCRVILGCFTLALVDFNRVILGLRWDNILFIEWLVVFFIERLCFYDFMRSQDDMPFLFCFKCNSIFLESRICLRQISTSAPGTCPDAFRWAAEPCEAREVHYPTSTPWWCVERRLQWLSSQGWAGISDEHTTKYVPFSYE